MQFDIAIVGGGIVGAATFYKIQKRNPTLKLALFEKENLGLALGSHTELYSAGR